MLYRRFPGDIMTIAEHGVWCKCQANRLLKNFIGFSVFRIVE